MLIDVKKQVMELSSVKSAWEWRFGPFAFGVVLHPKIISRSLILRIGRHAFVIGWDSAIGK